MSTSWKIPFPLMLCLLLGLGIILPGISAAQSTEEGQSNEIEEPADEEGPAVAEEALCLEVKKRQPVDKGKIFEPGKVYCWTRIVDAANTTITHNYFHKGKKLATVKLKIGGDSWRTWSYKTVMPSQTGSWRVEIRDQKNNLLKEMGFDVVLSKEESED